MADTQKDTVTVEHKAYQATAKARKIWEDVCAGTEAMRAGGKDYLPQFPAEIDEDWVYRKDTATLLNVTEKTIKSYCGLVFTDDPTLGDDVPDEIKGTDTDPGLVENIDNQGTHFNIFARNAFEESFDGWVGILVDMPSTTASDLGQQRSMGLRPYCIMYEACDIINWDYQIDPVSKKKRLSLVVLRERVSTKAGIFLRSDDVQYRVLWMNGSVPSWQLWTEDKNAKSEQKQYVLESEGVFRPQTGLPFAVVGELGEPPPMMDLAYKNIEHYQTYSDYKSILHKTCVPMLWTAGMDGEAPAAISGSMHWKLTENGKMGFAEPDGKSIAQVRQALQDEMGDMALLGLQMLMANRRANADITATEKLLDSIQETSSLQVRATQLQDALEETFGFMAVYLGKGEDAGGSIMLAATWTQMAVSSDELNSWVNQVELGMMSTRTFVELKHDAGMLPDDVDVDEELKRIDEEQKALTKITPVINAQNMPNEKTNGTPPPTPAPEPVAQAAA